MPRRLLSLRLLFDFGSRKLCKQANDHAAAGDQLYNTGCAPERIQPHGDVSSQQPLHSFRSHERRACRRINQTARFQKRVFRRRVAQTAAPARTAAAHSRSPRGNHWKERSAPKKAFLQTVDGAAHQPCRKRTLRFCPCTFRLLCVRLDQAYSL